MEIIIADKINKACITDQIYFDALGLGFNNGLLIMELLKEELNLKVDEPLIMEE